MYKVSGIYKAEEKLYLLADGCGRRMKQLNARTPREYWDHLTAQPSRDGELRHLLNEITIGETCLFRSQPQLDALRKVILPELVAEKTKQITKRLRIWSAGCSTGEEPYTLAMNMLEESERLLNGWTVEILATDLNDRSVEAAKAGIYGDYALRATTDYFKRKYFSAVGDEKTASASRGQEADHLQPAESAGRLQDAFHERHGPDFLLQRARSISTAPRSRR